MYGTVLPTKGGLIANEEGREGGIGRVNFVDAEKDGVETVFAQADFGVENMSFCLSEKDEKTSVYIINIKEIGNMGLL